jgi:hypothetical protein
MKIKCVQVSVSILYSLNIYSDSICTSYECIHVETAYNGCDHYHVTCRIRLPL